MKTKLLELSLLFCCAFFLCNPIKANSKNDTIHVVGHAHMDMDWLWTYFETMKMCNDNLRQTVAFMKEYPDFRMIQSQAAVYNFVEKVDPPLFDQIKKYVKEGRLELGGGMWVEGDENMPSGEAISRSFLLGQRYFLNHFGKMAKVGWLPDDFGHISQFPQILKLSNCDYFFFARCSPYPGTFWWVAPDSSKVLCYSNYNYGGDINEKVRDEFNQFVPGKHNLLKVIGVGDHGGGPSRAMIEKVHQLDQNPDFPAVKFTSVEDFFKSAVPEMKGRPTHRGEMGYIFEGCYTTVADNKEGNRNCENELYRSEFFNSLRWLNGDIYPAEELREVWKNVTFNQFHDIMCGSAINESNKESIARYVEGYRVARETGDNAFRRMADEIKFQSGLGQPIVAYNLHPVSRKTLVQAEVYSYNDPMLLKLKRGQGETVSVLVRDGAGKVYSAQILWSKVTPPGYTSQIEFIVDSLPPCGYKTFYADMTKKGEMTEDIPYVDNTFDTDYFKVKIDEETGNIISLIDKRTQKEYVKTGGQLNALRMYQEDRHGGMKAWNINKIVNEESLVNATNVRITENGPVRACVESTRVWGCSRFITRTYIYKSYPRIDYETEVRWLETGSDSTDSPMLRTIFPLILDKQPVFDCNVPFDVIARPINGQEVPAQKWVDLTDGANGIALINSTKYGHSYKDGELRLTLMRSAGDPDIYPNLGKYIIRYALYPHAGDWKNGVWSEGDEFNMPVYAAEPPSLALEKDHASLPEEKSFISLNTPNVVMTGLKQSENKKELIIRLVEIEGKEAETILSLPMTVQSVERLNLIELPLEKVALPVVKGEKIEVKIRPHEIVTLGVQFKKKLKE